jgi:hypothetical protein
MSGAWPRPAGPALIGIGAVVVLIFSGVNSVLLAHMGGVVLVACLRRARCRCGARRAGRKPQ